MLGYLTLLALLGHTLAWDTECCSAEDRSEVQAMWQKVWSAKYTGRRVQVAQAVFADLFERDPEAKGLFGRVKVDEFDSPEFKAHCIRVVNGLDTIIGLLEDPDTLIEQLDHLGGQHVARDGVHQSHFDEITHSFAKIMPQVSSCFNADAWDRCFSAMAQRIAKDLP